MLIQENLKDIPKGVMQIDGKNTKQKLENSVDAYLKSIKTKLK